MSVRKICLLGDFGVGKTSLVKRFVENAYDDRYLTTVGVKIDTKVVQLDNGEDIKLVIWDIAGTDSATPAFVSYLRGLAGYLLVVDGTRPETLESSHKLRTQLLAQLGTAPSIGLINKSDLVAKWAISDDDIAGLRNQGEQWLTSSALTGDNVEIAFSELARKLQ